MTFVLVIDNYDSFTYNLVQLFLEFEVEIRVARHDEMSIDQVAELTPDRICLSPGPKTPAQSGICRHIVQRFHREIPILGVCLGMQVINECFGGRTRHAPTPIHGKACPLFHKGGGLFRGLPSPFPAARYHSLCAEISSPDLAITAWGHDQVPLAIQHRVHPVFGLQFHPESFLSRFGAELIARFLAGTHFEVGP